MGSHITAAHRTLQPLPLLMEDSDAPQPRVPEESRQVLLAGMKGNGNATQEALTLALKLLAKAQLSPPIDETPDAQQTKTAGETPKDSPPTFDLGLTPALLKKAVGTLVVVLALVNPIVTQLSTNLFSSRGVVEGKLDSIVVSLAEYKASLIEYKTAQDLDRANLAQLAAWMVASEKARQAGTLPPDPPSMVSLMAAQDGVQRTTGK